MKSDEKKTKLPEQLATERQAAGQASPEQVAADKRRTIAKDTQAKLDRAAPPSNTTHWVFGAGIALIPLFVALYFVFFWEPSREVRNNASAQQPVEIEPREFVPARPEPLPPERPALPPHLIEPAISSGAKGAEKVASQAPGDQAIEDLSPKIRELPSLDYSDDEVLDALSSLSPVLDWYIWLYTDEVVRKFVAIIDNLAYGRVANKYISVPKPSKTFQGAELGEKQFITPTSYERYNAYADIFAALDNDDLVAVYSYYFPLLDEAYTELGYPDDRRFHGTMIQAIDMILSAPVIDGDIELIPSTAVLYKYANPSLESLPEIHKQLIRMGPRNTRIIQGKLAALRKALIR